MRLLRMAVVCLGALLGTATLQAANENVRITVSKANPPVISVDRETVTINRGDVVKWTCAASGGRFEIEFEFKNKRRGPFPSRKKGDNPSRGRYHKRVGKNITTRAAIDSGRWKYTVWWVAPGGAMYKLDPAIIVR